MDSIVSVVIKASVGESAIVKNWLIEPLTKEGDNYVCNVQTLKIQVVNGALCNYVIKSNPKRPEGTFDSIMNTGFQREADFIEKLCPKINALLKGNNLSPIVIPLGYFSVRTPGSEVLVLEDLRLKAFKMEDRLKGLNKDHAVLVLENLARLHAASAILNSQENIGELCPNMKDEWTCSSHPSYSHYELMLKQELQSVILLLESDIYWDSVVKWLRSILPNIMNVYHEAIVTPGGQFEAVCHGDCWNNNLLFRLDRRGLPSEVAFLDFQICRLASVATDINYFMYTSLPLHVRQDESLLSQYYSSFEETYKAAKLSASFTFKELLQEIKKRKIWGILNGAMFGRKAMLLQREKGKDFEWSRFYSIFEEIKNKGS